MCVRVCAHSYLNYTWRALWSHVCVCEYTHICVFVCMCERVCLCVSGCGYVCACHVCCLPLLFKVGVLKSVFACSCLAAQLLYEIWFEPYRRFKTNDSSGFEHVFVGEESRGKITGLHNWVNHNELLIMVELGKLSEK
jgi:hypothetical protein